MLAFRSDLLIVGLRVIVMQSHLISDTRPSHFSACNIEELGMGLGMRLLATKDSYTSRLGGGGLFDHFT